MGDPKSNGYNLTPGGQKGTTLIQIDDKELKEKYNKCHNFSILGHYFKCSPNTIKKRLIGLGVKIIPYKSNGNDSTKFKEGEGTKSVQIIELKKDFSSLKDCAI